MSSDLQLTIAQVYSQILFKRELRLKVDDGSDEQWYLEMEIMLLEDSYYNLTGIQVSKWHDSLVAFKDNNKYY